MSSKFLMLSLLCVVAAGVLAGDDIASNETAAAASCKAFAEGEEIYHRTDYQGAGVLQYAQCLHGGRQMPAAPAVDAAKVPKPTEDEKKSIAKLIAAMKDDDFATREKAFKDLRALGPKPYDQLVAAQKEEKDAEVIQRSRKLAEMICDDQNPLPKIDMHWGLLGSGQDELALIDRTFGNAECAIGADPSTITAKSGYLYRVLTRQGASATSGKRDYIVNGHMTLGYALLAFPKEYGTSGKKCFMINNNGTIFERDFGSKEKSEEFTKKCIEFDPDTSWVPTQ